jgi:peroxiredoxin Q/BCP
MGWEYGTGSEDIPRRVQPKAKPGVLSRFDNPPGLRPISSMAHGSLFGFRSPNGPLQAGDAAPVVSAVSDAGETVDLGQSYGRQEWTLVYFYPKADTPGCTKQGCSLRDGYAELTKRGVAVFGVSRDDVGAQAAFKARFRLPFTLLADTEGKVIAAFRVPTYPVVGMPHRQAYLIRGGRIVYADHKGTTDEQAAVILRFIGQAASG